MLIYVYSVLVGVLFAQSEIAIRLSDIRSKTLLVQSSVWLSVKTHLNYQPSESRSRFTNMNMTDNCHI